METIEEAGERFKEIGDFYSNELEIKGKKVRIISFFDLTKHHHELAQIFAGNNDVFDVRCLEMRFCGLAQTTMPFYKSYRGRIGLCLGILIGAVSGLFFKKPVKRFLNSRWSKKVSTAEQTNDEDRKDTTRSSGGYKNFSRPG